MSSINPEKIVILEELERLFPSPSEEAIAKLEESIESEGGALSDVWVWIDETGRPLLVDGHNRVRVCRKLKKPFGVRQVFQTAADIKEVKYRLRLAAVGQRNLSPAAERYNIGQIVKHQVEVKGTKVSIAVKELAKETGTSERHVWRAYERAQVTDNLSVDPAKHPGVLDLSVVELKQLETLGKEKAAETLERSGQDAKKIKRELREQVAKKGSPLYDAEQAKLAAKAKADKEAAAKKGVFKIAAEKVGYAGTSLAELKKHGVSTKEFEQAYSSLRLVAQLISDWQKRAEVKAGAK
jgi:hypothetical protein